LFNIEAVSERDIPCEDMIRSIFGGSSMVSFSWSWVRETAYQPMAGIMIMVMVWVVSAMRKFVVAVGGARSAAARGGDLQDVGPTR
jgi:hypothetical protein